MTNIPGMPVGASGIGGTCCAVSGACNMAQITQVEGS